MNGARCAFDLIAELDKAGPKHRVVALAVAFENSSVLIYADDPDRLRFLNEAIEAGGYPAGLIAIDYDGRELVIMIKLFECDATREELLPGLSSATGRGNREESREDKEQRVSEVAFHVWSSLVSHRKPYLTASDCCLVKWSGTRMVAFPSS
jgi:hypothetical protein